MYFLRNNVMLYMCLLDIRLNSLQYSQLKDKLQAPIRTARTVVIQQSLSDQFISAFREQVHTNGTYPISREPVRIC